MILRFSFLSLVDVLIACVIIHFFFVFFSLLFAGVNVKSRTAAGLGKFLWLMFLHSQIYYIITSRIKTSPLEFTKKHALLKRAIARSSG